MWTSESVLPPLSYSLGAFYARGDLGGKGRIHQYISYLHYYYVTFQYIFGVIDSIID